MKRIITFILVLLVLTSLFTGCTTKKSEDSTKDTTQTTTEDQITEKAKEKRVINFWHTFGSGVNAETLLGQVERFNKEYEGQIEVVPAFQGNYAETLGKYMTSIAAKTNPEIGVCDSPDTPRLIKLNVLEELTPLIKRDNVPIEDFIEGFLSYSKKDDNIYGLPYNRSTPIMYYNKDLFKKVFGHDNPPETWDDILNYCRELVKHNVAGISFEIENWYYGAFITQLGGAFLNTDGTEALLTKNDVGLDALKFWKQLVDEGLYLVPPLTSPGSFMLEQFYQGKVGILLQSTGNIGSVLTNTEGKFEVGGAFMPKNIDRGFATGGGNLIIFSNHNDLQKDAAWEFMKFMTSPEENAVFNKSTGYMITRKSAKDLKIIQDLWAEKPIYKIAFDQLAYVKDTYVSADWAELNLEIKKVLQAMVQDKKLTAEQAYEEIKAACETILPNGYYKQ
jgi:sn-glycerol 3-phosphate transport system substrate-binding protein